MDYVLEADPEKLKEAVETYKQQKIQEKAAKKKDKIL